MRIIFFDGHCNLCNGFVDFLIKRDQKRRFKFASLQGNAAKEFLNDDEIGPDPTTVIYIKDGIKFEKSTAALKILTDLGGVWKLVKIFFVVPRPLRDAIYRFIAKNRYAIFGKSQSCRRPSEEEKKQFLD